MAHTGGTPRELRCPPTLRDIPPSRTTWWRNKGKNLAVLEAPGSEKVCAYIEPGAEFAAVRVVALACGKRYIQLTGGGWVSECSRKDATKVVAVPIAEHERESLGGVVSPPSATSNASVDGEAVSKRRRISAEDGQANKELPALSSRAVRVRKLRFTIRATKAGTSTACMQIGEMALRCKGQTMSLAGFKATSPSSYTPLTEGPEKLLQAPGKFLDQNFSTHKRTVVIVEAPGLIEVEEFAWRTANDMPARDPGHVVIDGSVDGKEWTLLMDSGAHMPMPEMRRTWSPWFVLREQGKAEEQVAVSSTGAKRFICTVPNCGSYQASAEGYLFEGKLLHHMLRHHRRSPKTAELAKKLEDAGKLKSKDKKLAPQESDAAAAGASQEHAKEGQERNEEEPAADSSSSSNSSSSSEDEEAQRPEAAKSTPAGHPETPQRKNRVVESTPDGAMRQTPPPVEQRKGGSAANFKIEVSGALTSEANAEILEAAARIPRRSACPGSTEPVLIGDLNALHRYPPFEGTVSGRRKVHNDGSFAVTLLDPSGSVDVTFVGAAAEAFQSDACLQDGGCLRLEGYDLIPTKTKGPCSYEILVASANAAVSVAPPDSEAEGPATPALTPLDAIKSAVLHSVVNVEAVVQDVRPLISVSRVDSRTLVLRQGEATALLILRRDKAPGRGAELLGRHIIVRGTRIVEFRGQRLLSGWRRLEFAG